MSIKYLTLFLAIVLARLPGSAQNEWTLKKDKDSIRVYNRGNDQSKFDELKVEITLKAKLSDLAALILDINEYKNWSFNTKSTHVLKQVSPSELYFYSEINSPWPVDDRDLALHLLITQDPVSKIMSIKVKSVPDLIPVKPNTVRVPLSNENWTVTRLDRTRIRIEYQLKLDPGGTIPAWLINTFSVKGPFETFKNLRREIQQPKYRNASVPFISN